MRSWQGSFGSDLSYIPDFDFVTKVNFCHEGLAAVRRDGILSLGIVILLTKIAPVFAPATRRGAARIWLIEFVLPSPRLRILAFICMHCIQIYLSFG